MINGAHIVVYSRDPDADRAFLRDVLNFPSVDVGGGWLIFGIPPAEIAVHPAMSGAGESGGDAQAQPVMENGRHELYLMTPDVEAFAVDMKKMGVPCTPIEDQPWGRLTAISLPGGGEVGVYQPHHDRPPNPA